MLPTYGVSIRGDTVRVVSVRQDIAGLPSPANDDFFRALVGQTVCLVATENHPARLRRPLHRQWDGLPTAIYKLSRPLPDSDFETDLVDAAVALPEDDHDPDRVARLWRDARSDRPLDERVATLTGELLESRLTSWHAAQALLQLEIGSPGAASPAVPTLARLVDQTHLNPSCYAMRALGAIGDPRAVGPLTLVLGRDDNTRITYALRALGILGPSIAADSIDRLRVTRSEAPWQRAAIAGAVAWARWRVLGEGPAPFLAFSTPDPDTSGALLEILWDCPTPLLAEVLPLIPRLDQVVQQDWVAQLRQRLD